MKTLFVTGTDTGVGKTTVASALCAWLSLRKGMNVGVMKPFETGLSKTAKDQLPGDAICLKEASGSSDDLSLVSPYTFEAALAPEVAAAMEHVIIDLGLIDRIHQGLSKSHDVLVVEGAGGVLVPIMRGFFYADLMQRWDVVAVVVSRLGLGTINHTLLTCNYLELKGVKVAGVILNDVAGVPNLAAKTNPQALREYLNVPLLGTFPHTRSLLEGRLDRELLAGVFENSINTEELKDLY